MENINIYKEYKNALEELDKGLSELNLVAANEAGMIETVAGFIVTGSKRIMGVLDSISTSFSTFLSLQFSSTGFNGYLADLLRFKNKFDKYSKKLSFREIENISIPVTPGLKNNLKTFSDFLDNHIMILSDFSSVDKLNTLVSELLSLDDVAKSHISNRIDTKTMEAIVENVKKDLDKLIDPKDFTDKKKIKDLVPSIMSIQPLIENGIKFSNEINIKKLDEVKETINLINNRISILVDEIKNSNKTISKEKLKDLTDQIRVTGNFVSTTMTIFYLYTQYMSIVIKIGDVMKSKA